MILYVIKRISFTIPMIFLLVLLTWTLSQLMPGDPSSFFPITTNPQIILDFRAKWHLDDPWYMQLGVYLTNLLHGDMGKSATVAPGWNVSDYLAIIFPRTLEIAIIPILIIPIFGIRSGILTVKHRNKWQDILVRGVAVFGMALPSFFLGLILQYTFGYYIPSITGGQFNLPVSGFKTSGFPDPETITHFRLLDSIIANDLTLFLDTAQHLILPVSCQILLSFATITRQTRSSMLDVMQQDYIRTARAKGCPEKLVYGKHALKNALIPTLTVIISGGFALLAGTTIIEITFNIRGMGTTLVRAILFNDYWLIMGIVQVIGILVIMGNLVADIVYTIVDPRIMYS